MKIIFKIIIIFIYEILCFTVSTKNPLVDIKLTDSLHSQVFHSINLNFNLVPYFYLNIILFYKFNLDITRQVIRF